MQFDQVHCSPSPHQPQDIPWLWTLIIIFPEKSILYTPNFVVLKDCTIGFTRLYFSYKECTCEISCTKFCTVRGYCWRKKGGRIIFSPKDPTKSTELCTTDVQFLVKSLWVRLNILTLYVKCTDSFGQPYSQSNSRLLSFAGTVTHQALKRSRMCKGIGFTGRT